MKEDKMKYAICAGLLALGLTAIADTELEQNMLPQNVPVQALIGEMAKGDGISESEAKEIAIEVCKRLWGSEFLKVNSCKLDESGAKWEVRLFANDGVVGWGCRVWILKTGALEKAEFNPGL